MHPVSHPDHAATSLVTGAAGFIGSHLVDALLDRGDRVIGVDNFVRGQRENLAHLSGCERFHLIEADLSSEEGWRGPLTSLLEEEMVHSLWHLAANSDVAAGVADSDVDLRQTFLTTISALRIAREFQIGSVLFTSSSAVYGESDRELDEDSGPLCPISNYGAMKLASEAALSAACGSWLQRGVAMRLPNVVGSRCTHGVLFDLPKRLAKDPERLEVLGDGYQRKPYMHVRRIVEALLFLEDRAPAGFGRFNIGPEDEITVRDIVSLLTGTLGLSPEVHYGGADRGWVGDVPHYRYRTGRLRSLGWRAQEKSAEAVGTACMELAQNWKDSRCSQ
ncbi:NAD-dependent epimerase/dehydratase family protein [Silvibacterium acidisoli]|uniref:NAD-dependent epimerase/dehydratase family protein n=1 Tax=Acidobacteriaceae bacterium ZG23-2 TaxID=2883246 RepID=UPI00406CD449